MNKASLSTEEMVELYKVGYSCNRIAKKAGVSTAAIQNRVKGRVKMRSKSEAAILVQQMKKSPGPSSETRRQKSKSKNTRGASKLTTRQMVALYTKGCAPIKIAQRAGISPQSVNYHLKRAGVRRSGNGVDTTVKEITQAYERGASLRSLAQRYKISHESIRRQLHANGTQLRRSRKVIMKISVPRKSEKSVMLALQDLRCQRV